MCVLIMFMCVLIMFMCVLRSNDVIVYILLDYENVHGKVKFIPYYYYIRIKWWEIGH